LAKDALDKNFKALMGREDPMLAYGTAISLRFEVRYFNVFCRCVEGHVLTGFSSSLRAMPLGLAK
jgi:hypothetical protein